MMSKNKSQRAFWVNAIIYRSLFDGLLAYVNDLSLFLDSKAAHLKGSEPSDFEEENSETEHAITVEQYDSIFPVLLCNSFIITLVSVLERELANFANTLAKVSNLNFNLSGTQDSVFEKFKSFGSKDAQLPFDFGGKQWNDIKGLVEVRNAIVHNHGVLDESPRLATIRGLNKRYPTLTITGSHIRPSIPFCNDMISLVHSFLRTLTDAAYKRFQ